MVPRRYTNGSWLVAHIDKWVWAEGVKVVFALLVSRFETHVISAILNIGQAVTRDWELHILDNEGAPHTLTLQVSVCRDLWLCCISELVGTEQYTACHVSQATHSAL